MQLRLSVSMTNQECEVRLQIVNVNVDKPLFYPVSIKTSKCSGSCNNISYSYAKMCVPYVVKNINVKVFNLISRTNEKRHLEWNETFKCKCRLDASVCNNEQRWNDDKCRCECKELIDKGICDKGFIWNPSYCECECNKSCDVGEYLDYKNCKCKKNLVDKLVKRSSAVECTEKIDEANIAEITLIELHSMDLHSAGHESVFVCSYTICVILTVIALAISIRIGAYFLILVGT